MSDPTPRSYKLGCIVRGEHDRVHYNGLRFATFDECDDYGRDLYRRWTMLDGWQVEPCDEPVTYRMVDGIAYSLSALEPKSDLFGDDAASGGKWAP